MFADMLNTCDIAKQFSMGATKTSYMISFGLAPYFASQVYRAVNFSYFSPCFDETFNSFNNKEQLDVHCIYFDQGTGQVFRRYLGSSFLRNARANDLLDGLTTILQNVPTRNIVEIGVDRPSFLSIVDKMRHYVGAEISKPTTGRSRYCNWSLRTTT